MGAVSYLNTKPLLYGIENSPVIQEIALVTEYPAKIADMLLNDQIDIGLVPVAIIPKMREFYINTRFCIGSNGPVASVCLFSELPLTEIDTVLLDYESRTSVALVKILLKKYWNLNPKYEPAGPDFIGRIKGRTAALVIGDRALQLRPVTRYIFDLGEAWKKMTGLPFVYAAWVSNKQLDKQWVDRFDQANAYGLQNIQKVLEDSFSPVIDLQSYYRDFLSYELDEDKKKGLALFLKMLADKE